MASFQNLGNQWQIFDQIRRSVEFQQLNLVTHSFRQFNQLDIIFLRNVLIYFNLSVKKAGLEKIRTILAPDGYLFLGGGETTLNLDDSFERVQLDKNELQTFRWVAGAYESAELTDGRSLIPPLGLSLGLWQGCYQGIERLWLRWFTSQGDLIPLPQEDAIAANQRATLAEERAERLAARLRELGVNPDELD
ncbi:MAG: CheR family methyltransferase [Coleofasciculus sp.]